MSFYVKEKGLRHITRFVKAVKPNAAEMVKQGSSNLNVCVEGSRIYTEDNTILNPKALS